MRDGLTLKQAKARILEDGYTDGSSACFAAIKKEINQMPYAFPLVNQTLLQKNAPLEINHQRAAVEKGCCILHQDESKSITTAISSKASDQKSHHLAKAAEYFSRAKELIEVDQDWQACGSMILRALAEERKSENTGLQVMNVIKYQKPKTKLEFNFRS